VDVRDYLRAIRGHWWMLAAAVALAEAVAALVTYYTPPQYATSMTFFIGTPNRGVIDAYQGTLLSQQRVKSYATVLSGDRLAAVVAQQSGIGLSPGEIQGRITAEPVPDTVLLRATVTDGSKTRAKRIADVVATEFTTMVESLETPPAATDAGGGASGAAGNPTVKVEIIAGPQLNLTPVSPRPARNLGLATVLGLLLGAGMAVLREMTDKAVKSTEQLQELTGAPVLAAIPFDPAASKSLLVSGVASRSPRAEALRKLRTNLQFVDVDRPVRLMVVTSAIASEGKSSTALNLAVVFAEAGQRVLVIDADLRRPKVAEYLGIEGAVGLTDVLAGRVQPEDAVQPWGRGMWVLPSGFRPPNPSELLASHQMGDLLRRMRERYDMVIIDSPPLVPVTDGAVLAAASDGALLVGRAAKTSSSHIAIARRALDAVSAKLLGCAFNMVPPTKNDHYNYYYGNHHRTIGGRSAQQPVMEDQDVRTVPAKPSPSTRSPMNASLHPSDLPTVILGRVKAPIPGSVSTEPGQGQPLTVQNATPAVPGRQGS
jgi:capsular exopolysaccharide synthesis family protein